MERRFEAGCWERFARSKAAARRFTPQPARVAPFSKEFAVDFTDNGDSTNPENLYQITGHSLAVLCLEPLRAANPTPKDGSESRLESSSIKVNEG
jgi:hypothetical protein